VSGCPTYLETWSPPLDEAIRILQAAGGATVLAHSRWRGSHVTPERFRELKAVGLQGIEVDHVEHDQDARRQLRQIATDHDLLVTGSSDYHGTRKPNRLGCETTAPEQYERLRALLAVGRAAA